MYICIYVYTSLWQQPSIVSKTNGISNNNGCIFKKLNRRAVHRTFMEIIFLYFHFNCICLIDSLELLCSFRNQQKMQQQKYEETKRRIVLQTICTYVYMCYVHTYNHIHKLCIINKLPQVGRCITYNTYIHVALLLAPGGPLLCFLKHIYGIHTHMHINNVKSPAFKCRWLHRSNSNHLT